MQKSDQARVTVVLRGRTRVQVLGVAARYRGELTPPAQAGGAAAPQGEPRLALRGDLGADLERLRLGDEVAITVQLGRGARAALLGRVVAFDGASRHLRVAPGASFELEVTLVRKDGACLPPAALFGAPRRDAHAEEEQDEPSWPTSPRGAGRVEVGTSRRGADLTDPRTLVGSTEITSRLASSVLSLGTAELDALLATGEVLDDGDPDTAEPEPDLISEPEAPNEVSGVVGNLAVMNLVDLVQTMEICAKTARVDVAPRDGAEGHLFFERGALVHAFWNHLAGEEAFFHLLGVDEGLFRVRIGRTTTARSIASPAAFLIMEAARRMDEEARERDEATQTLVAPLLR